MQVTYIQPSGNKKDVIVHNKTGRTTSGGPRECSTGGPMEKGPLWFYLMRVSLFRLMHGRDSPRTKGILFVLKGPHNQEFHL